MNSREVIIRIISKKLIPLILLFALYVQFHGDFGQEEVSSWCNFLCWFDFIFIGFGFDKLVSAVSPRVLELFCNRRVIVYRSWILCMLLGENF